MFDQIGDSYHRPRLPAPAGVSKFHKSLDILSMTFIKMFGEHYSDAYPFVFTVSKQISCSI
jgi:hypothetical protein